MSKSQLCRIWGKSVLTACAKALKWERTGLRIQKQSKVRLTRGPGQDCDGHRGCEKEFRFYSEFSGKLLKDF